MEGKRTPKRREERAGANLLDYDEFATTSRGRTRANSSTVCPAED